MKPFCVAIDWGTTTFRLWLLNSDGKRMIERRSDEGLLQAQAAGFKNIVEQYLGTFGVEDNLPVIVCGMAGSRQGWQEARYVDTPSELNQIIDNAVTVPHRSYDIRILPGIAQRNLLNPDVMRGEETQLLGLLDQLPEDGFVCMPGTHSKWVNFKQGQLQHFSTFMTGELFGLLANHSILRLGEGEPREFSPGTPTFLRSLGQSVDNPQEITNRLFKARSSYLLGYTSLASSAAELSGSVIGLEIAGALSRYGPIEKVTLVATGQLAELYQSALKSQGISVDSLDADDAVRSGLYTAARVLWSHKHERIQREA